jgi:hypothetical protein
MPRQYGESFGSPEPTDAQQSAKVTIALAVDRPNDHRWAIDRVELATDHKTQLLILGRRVGSDDASKGIAIADCKP